MTNGPDATMSDSFAVARARRALEEAGLPVDLPLERASSVTNEVWLSDRTTSSGSTAARTSGSAARRCSAPAAAEQVGYPDHRGLRRPARRRLADRRPRARSAAEPVLAGHDASTSAARPSRQLADMLRALHHVRLPRRRARGRRPRSCSPATHVPRRRPAARAPSTRPEPRCPRRRRADRPQSDSSCSTPARRSSPYNQSDVRPRRPHVRERAVGRRRRHRPARLRVRRAGPGRPRPRRVPALLRLPVPARGRGLRAPRPGPSTTPRCRSGWPRSTPSCSSCAHEFERAAALLDRLRRARAPGASRRSAGCGSCPAPSAPPARTHGRRAGPPRPLAGSSDASTRRSTPSADRRASTPRAVGLRCPWLRAPLGTTPSWLAVAVDVRARSGGRRVRRSSDASGRRRSPADEEDDTRRSRLVQMLTRRPRILLAGSMRSDSTRAARAA